MFVEVIIFVKCEITNWRPHKIHIFISVWMAATKEPLKAGI
jgi:hypothetical protein